jgi:hypothetical protein
MEMPELFDIVYHARKFIGRAFGRQVLAQAGNSGLSCFDAVLARSSPNIVPPKPMREMTTPLTLA